MNSTKLSIFFTQLSHSQRRMQYCRQILFETFNSNFRPMSNNADVHHQSIKYRNNCLISIFQKIDDQSQGHFSAEDFKNFIRRQGFNYSQKQSQIIFAFFDLKKQNKVKAKTMCDILKPIKIISDDKLTNQYKTERQKENISQINEAFTLQVKYALKRLLDQILENDKTLDFIKAQLMLLFKDENQRTNIMPFTESEFTLDLFKRFMSINQRFPDEKAISLILRGLEYISNYFSMSKLLSYMQQQCQTKNKQQSQKLSCLRLEDQSNDTRNRQQQNYKKQFEYKNSEIKSDLTSPDNKLKRLQTINQEETFTVVTQQQIGQTKLATFGSNKDLYQGQTLQNKYTNFSQKTQPNRQYYQKVNETFSNQKQMPYKFLLPPRTQQKSRENMKATQQDKNHLKIMSQDAYRLKVRAQEKQHLKSSLVTKSEVIHKPKKIIKNASGKENKVRVQNNTKTLTPVKNEQITSVLNKIQGLRDVTNQILKRL